LRVRVARAVQVEQKRTLKILTGFDSGCCELARTVWCQLVGDHRSADVRQDIVSIPANVFLKSRHWGCSRLERFMNRPCKSYPQTIGQGRKPLPAKSRHSNQELGGKRQSIDIALSGVRGNLRGRF
jgi:hypothetical protein